MSGYVVITSSLTARMNPFNMNDRPTLLLILLFLIEGTPKHVKSKAHYYIILINSHFITSLFLTCKQCLRRIHSPVSHL